MPKKFSVTSDRTTGKAFSWRVWLGLLISALFGYLALRHVDPARMWLVIRSADPALYALVILLNVFQYVADKTIVP